jgi:hypothetical protein
MPYTIVDDGDEICIRATISQRWELAELVTKLQQRVDGKEVNLTTYVEDRYRKGDVSGGIVTGVTITSDTGPDPYDAQDVNRKELSNE